jgi:hypothetical protein
LLNVIVGPASSTPDSGFALRMTIAVISLLMLAIGRGPSPPLVCQMPLAVAPR